MKSIKGISSIYKSSLGIVLQSVAFCSIFYGFLHSFYALFQKMFILTKIIFYLFLLFHYNLGNWHRRDPHGSELKENCLAIAYILIICTIFSMLSDSSFNEKRTKPPWLTGSRALSSGKRLIGDRQGGMSTTTLSFSYFCLCRMILLNGNFLFVEFSRISPEITTQQ